MAKSLQFVPRESAPIRAIVFLLVSFLFPRTGLATDVFFRDFTVFSPNRQFRLEAKSPDNAGKLRKAFAKNFVFRLYQGNTQKLIWQARDLVGSPVRARIRNDGWVVIHSHWSGLTFVDPKGHKTGGQPVVHAYLRDDVKKYVSMTTAGPMWEGHSHWFFADVGKHPYYCLRTWWKRRVVFDLMTGRQAVDKGKLKGAIDVVERRSVLKTVSDGAKRVRTTARKGQEDIDIKDSGPVTVAAYMAGRLGYQEAVQDLRTLEKVDNLGGCVAYFYPREKPGEVHPFTFCTLSVRQMAQLSLRRLGQRPSERPVTEFSVYVGEGKDSVTFKPLKHEKPRAERAHAVKAGQTALEILRILGPPDHVDGDKRAWEFDIDVKPPYTLRIHWKGLTIRAVEKVKPPAWKVGHVRDEGLN